MFFSGAHFREIDKMCFCSKLQAESPGTYLYDCFRPDLSSVMIKDYSINNSLVLMQKMSQISCSQKGLLARTCKQVQVAQIHWFDVGPVLLWIGSLITHLFLRVQTHCAQKAFLHSPYSRVFRSISVLTEPSKHTTGRLRGISDLF